MSETLLDRIRVLPWKGPKHLAPLTSMMQRMLAVQEVRGSYVAPTVRNAERMVLTGYAMASQGDPCLLAELDNKAIAMVMWGDNNQGIFDLNKRVCNTMGSFTEPEYRHQGVSELLRAVAYNMAVERGYELLDGFIWTDNERGLEHFKGFHNARVLAQHLALDIKQPS